MDDEQIRELVRTSRAAQGLPPKVEDRETLDRIARLFLSSEPKTAQEEPDRPT